MNKLDILTANSVGIGLRKPHFEALAKQLPDSIDFLELAPENWMHMGGKRKKYLAKFLAHYPIILHGLSLSLGSPAELNKDFIKDLKQFMQQHPFIYYSEHLSYCSDEGMLYDLLPIPFTEEAVDYVANRIIQVQEILGQRIAVENISYYDAPGQELSEIDFINAVLAKADCDLLLDVNNVYVNSFNHHYDPIEFIKKLKPNKIAYIHIAGHWQKDEDLIIDTHGEDITDPVWKLLEVAYETFGLIPTLLERDSNLPPLNDLLKEVEQIRQIQQQVLQHEYAS